MTTAAEPQASSSSSAPASSSSSSQVVSRVSAPVSETLLNDKVRPNCDHELSLHHAHSTSFYYLSTQANERATCLRLQWDLCLSNAIIKSGLGLGFGIVFSVLLFKRRAFPAWVGLGFGAGRGYAECDASFKNAAGSRNVRA
ncbi:hypothetical protein Dda_2972 [Drechslerella dactyloides]|uniref:MICOS complex subunit MIC10 n=1 Tax=Drechslerella dactyloides TaxID=74499 RepID=A0AAD6J4X8_DREDA|nr:hypothetical protein Dda_2972 [Drechslerella dactyloides]